MCEIHFSKFCYIQATRDMNYTTYKHVFQLKTDHYNSVILLDNQKTEEKINDITKEKVMVKFSMNILNYIENSSELTLDTLETKFYENSKDEIIIENFEKCYTYISFNLKPEKPLPIVMFSTLFNPRISKFSQSFYKHSLNSLTLNPKLKISKSKLLGYLNKLPSVNLTHHSSEIIFCQGSYCKIKIEQNSILQKKKIPFKKYISISHNIVKQTLEKITFPISNSEFDSIFDKIFEELLLKHYKFKVKSFDRSLYHNFHENDLIPLCQVCFKIFHNAYLKEYPFRRLL